MTIPTRIRAAAPRLQEERGVALAAEIVSVQRPALGGPRLSRERHRGEQQQEADVKVHDAASGRIR